MEDAASVLLGVPRLTRLDLEAELPDLPHLRLWHALGFPQLDPEERAFSTADLQAVRDAAALRDALRIDDDTLVSLARSLAQSMGGLADAHVRLFAAGAGDDAAARDTAAVMARLIEYVWRRHLAAAALGTHTAQGDAVAVAFVDLVGYTQLARRTDPATLERTLERFEDLVQTTAAQHGARVVKSLGDGILLAAPLAAQAATTALAVLAVLDADDDQPSAHAGLAAGPLLSRHGDVYGEPVNLASRLTDLARPGTLLADEQAAIALEGDPAFAVKPAGVRKVRGYDHLKTWRVRATAPLPTAGNGSDQVSASSSANAA